MDKAPPSISSFNLLSSDGANKNMIEYAKMAILLAFEEYPNDDLEKCRLISNKFHEKYGHKWGVSIIKDGDSLFYYHDYYLYIKYKDYSIKIMRTK